jgi:hypothetical protein
MPKLLARMNKGKLSSWSRIELDSGEVATSSSLVGLT